MSQERKPRLDSKLEAEGAEFLVLGRLLIEGISAYKAYRNTGGYDVVAVLPETNRSARIQVKSRWATDAGGFLMRKEDCDFVVLVRLNRGYRYRSSINADGRREPEFYVFPVSTVMAARAPASTWGRIEWKKIPDLETYRSRWDLISSFLLKSELNRESVQE